MKLDPTTKLLTTRDIYVMILDVVKDLEDELKENAFISSHLSSMGINPHDGLNAESREILKSFLVKRMYLNDLDFRQKVAVHQSLSMILKTVGDYGGKIKENILLKKG